jgi:hypothetical protein
MLFDVNTDDVLVRARTRKAFAFVGVVMLHGLVFVAVSRITPPRTKEQAELVSTLFWVEPRKRKPEDKKKTSEIERRTEPPSPAKNPQTEVSSTAPLAIPAIDWNAERNRAAEQRANKEFAEPAQRPLISKPKVMELPKKKVEHKPGDTQRFDDGEIITWISDKCYVTNREPVTPRLDPKAINVQCRLGGRPPIVDGFDHIKPKYLRKEGEEVAKPKSLFTGETVECEYSSTVCESYRP